MRGEGKVYALDVNCFSSEVGTRLIVVILFELFPGTIAEEAEGSFSSDVGIRFVTVLVLLLLFPPEIIVEEEEFIDAEEDLDSGAFGVVLGGGNGGDEGV